jgi:predicted secreted hydrolase
MSCKNFAIAIFLSLVVALPAYGVYVLTRPDERLGVQAELAITEALNSAADAGFARVLEPRQFSFPEDHGPHPEYGIEWWYYTGNLDSPEGRHFGFELALFRIGLESNQPDRGSRWATSQLYMGHFAITDVHNNQFYSFERFSRAAMGLAGASVLNDQRFQVWLEDWSIEGEGAATPNIRLKAAEENIAIDLMLVSGKPVVLQGDKGLSQKSPGPGNASYYYSITRMPTSGTLSIGERSFTVEGISWMDREWSTTALAEEQSGWDWFALQLSEGSDIMFYQLRLRNGGVDPLSNGKIILGDGSTLDLTPEDVQIQVLDYWESPRGGSYPSKWRMRIPSQSADLEITPYINNQELDVSLRYWEGAVWIRGTYKGQPISGNGYVELTGYATDSDEPPDKGALEKLDQLRQR